MPKAWLLLLFSSTVELFAHLIVFLYSQIRPRDRSALRNIEPGRYPAPLTRPPFGAAFSCRGQAINFLTVTLTTSPTRNASERVPARPDAKRLFVTPITFAGLILGYNDYEG